MWDGYAHLRMVGHGVKKILEVWENVEDIDLIVMSMAHAWHLDHYIRGGYTKYSGKYYVLRMQLDIDPEEFIRFKSVIFELPSSNNKFTSAFASKYTPKVLNEVVR